MYRSSFVLAVRKVNKNAGFTDCVAGMLNHIAVGHGIVQYLLGFCRQRLDFRSWLHVLYGLSSILVLSYRIRWLQLTQYFIKQKTIEVFLCFNLSPFFFLFMTNRITFISCRLSPILE